MNDSMMRRLASPSSLFALWTALFLVSAFPALIHNISGTHLTHHVPTLKPISIRPFPVLAALRPLVRYLPLSYPFFAIVFALWPHVTRRSLDASLGRWQFALATLPVILSVFFGAAIISGSRIGTVGPKAVLTGSPLLPLVAETTLYVGLSFWLVSLALFAVNVIKTIGRQSPS